MATIKDVAREAGVSAATVSRTLAGYPHVSPDTRERVLKAVERLGYRPDQVARSLRRRRSNLIGLVVSTIENVFFTEVARAAEQAAHRHGYNLIVCNTEEDPQQEETYLGVLDRQLVAGVILAPAPGEALHLAPYLEQGLPIVLINRRLEGMPCTSITSDDDQAAYELVRWLASQGKRRIAAVIGLPGVFTTRERLRGYRRALADLGIPHDPALEVSGMARLEGGYRAARDLLQRDDPPDAFCAFNNLMTQGVVMALQDLGITWPDPVDVAGFGAFGAARLYRPPLTLVEQPTHEMGERAVEALLVQVEGRADCPHEAIVLRNRIITREEWLLRRQGPPSSDRSAGVSSLT